MRNIVLIITLICVSSFVANAQNVKKQRPLEFEVAVGGVFARYIDAFDSEPGIQFLLETRYNLLSSNLDIGWQLSLGAFDTKSSLYKVRVVNKATMTTFVDYNLFRHEKFTPFFGLGLGMSFVDEQIEDSGVLFGTTTAEDRTATLTPRVGVEFVDRLRLTMEYKIMKKEYSSFNINLGFVFGGGQK